jgi:hypothetical protein
LFTGKTTNIRCVVEPWFTDDLDPLVVRARQALAAVGRTEVDPRAWDSDPARIGTGGGVLVRRHHIPTLGFGPGDGHAAYSRREFVAVEALRKAVLGNASIAQAILGSFSPNWVAA